MQFPLSPKECHPTWTSINATLFFGSHRALVRGKSRGHLKSLDVSGGEKTHDCCDPNLFPPGFLRGEQVAKRLGTLHCIGSPPPGSLAPGSMSVGNVVSLGSLSLRTNLT